MKGERAVLQVKNFSKFQHYRDRNPPWIKFYYETLDDYEFASLPDAAKWHLVAIWLLASRSDNATPADPLWIARRINATEPVDLRKLAELGFIEVDQACSKLLAKRKQSAMPETETETETETEPPIGPPRGTASKEQANVRRSKRAPMGTRLPADWQLSSEDHAYAAELGLDPLIAAEEFRNYWLALPGARARKLDWSRTFRNRCLALAGRGGRGRLQREPAGIVEIGARIAAKFAEEERRADEAQRANAGGHAVPDGDKVAAASGDRQGRVDWNSRGGTGEISGGHSENGAAEVGVELGVVAVPERYSG